MRGIAPHLTAVLDSQSTGSPREASVRRIPRATPLVAESRLTILRVDSMGIQPSCELSRKRGAQDMDGSGLSAGFDSLRGPGCAGSRLGL